MPKNAVLGSILSLGLLFGSLVYGQMGMPQQNVSGKRHPNLAAAQRLCEQAFEKIQAAQQANEFDMSGHAAKAKELLDQANHELKQAAESANKH
jgi:F0F1-type ATP synthase membrane subunit b/b'